MRTILVVFTNDTLTIEQINSRKMQKYCFRTESEINVGDTLKSNNYERKMVVTDVINTDKKYYNAQTGELSNEITSTKCYPIKTLELREENDNVVYAKKTEV